MKYLFGLSFLVILSCISHISNACVCTNYYRDVDSLAELEPFDFVALVKVTSGKSYKNADNEGHAGIALLGVKVLEQFKGKPTGEIFEYEKNSSCDLGIEIGEEWVVFARIEDGKPAIRACGRNVRLKDKNGMRDWHFNRGIRELTDLRKLYQHTVKPPRDGVNQQFYPNGKVEVEETYSNGMKNGPRTIYYTNGSRFGAQHYVNDSLDGESSWYYPSGQLYDRGYFLNGRSQNVRRIYYDSTIDQHQRKFLIKEFYETEDSMNFIYHRIQVHYETVYDFPGREILSREYSRLGLLIREHIYEPDRKFSTYIYYHDNGNISEIGHSFEYKNFGHVQGYDKNGKPTRSWDYDKDGREIKNK